MTTTMGYPIINPPNPNMCSDSNPYEPADTEVPSGPFTCGVEQTLNAQCVLDAQAALAAAKAAAYASASTSYMLNCQVYADAEQAAYDAWLVCFAAAQGPNDWADCWNTHAGATNGPGRDFYDAKQSVKAAFDQEIANATTTFFAAVAECCESN
jgi:hypothetical protein